MSHVLGGQWLDLKYDPWEGEVKRIVLREEGLRGDDTRTDTRAIDRWRNSQAKHGNELAAVREVRIAKSQPRPMTTREMSRVAGLQRADLLSHRLPTDGRTDGDE